jgi:hypothetical protein
VIVVVAVAVTIRSARRAIAERDAVERHHHALDVLGSLAERAEAVPVAITRPPSLRASPVPAVPAPEYQPRHRRARRPPPRPAPIAFAVLCLIVAALAIWFLAVHDRGGGSKESHGRTPITANRPATGRAGATAPTPRPTTTTAPVASLVLLTNDSQSARYRVNRPSADVELVATAPCWVEIKTELGSGPTVFVGTLRPGSRQAVPTAPTTGGVSIRLGNPGGMSVTVDGAALPVPGLTGAQPFTLTLQPPA